METPENRNIEEVIEKQLRDRENEAKNKQNMRKT